MICDVGGLGSRTAIGDTSDRISRESFDNIYLNLSKEPGKCRLAESGLGWKPTGGQTFTLDKAELISAQWSRAAKAHELKIYARHAGVVQLDGFKQEVSCGTCERPVQCADAETGLRDDRKVLQSMVWYRLHPQGACPAWLELGKARVD
jgi:hypothetical protein